MRSCGTCSACCRWPEIPSLGKSRGVTCGHLSSIRSNRGRSCTIYGRHPHECSAYQCAWLEGHGHVSDQPDSSGVLIERRDSQFGDVLIAKDLGGPSGPKRKAIKRVSRDANMICLLVDNVDPEKVLFVAGPRDLLAELCERHPELKRVEAA